MDLNLDQPAMPKGAGNGANFLKQLLAKPIYFDIEVGDFIYSHPYIHNDQIFFLSKANPNQNGGEIKDGCCNCCEFQYKNYKDAKLW
jgi:hypothetical protein